MSVRAVRCPKCGITTRVSDAIVSARCPSCGVVFPAQSAAVRAPSSGRRNASSQGDSSGRLLLATGAAFGGLLVVALLAVGFWMARPQLSPSEPPSETSQSSSAEPLAADQPILPEPSQAELDALVIVDLPEEKRRAIYDQVRATAVTTTEKPLMMPEQIRGSTERTLQSVYDQSLQQLAALHDLSVKQVEQIVAEGDTKHWDPSPRSHARRGGKRVYSEERSIGWEAH